MVLFALLPNGDFHCFDVTSILLYSCFKANGRNDVSFLKPHSPVRYKGRPRLSLNALYLVMTYAGIR